jgi:pyrroloquinoline quinone (PQQ) biosynthesis protein C
MAKMRDWTLELGRRCEGRNAYVDSWALEKLAKVAEAIAQARDSILLASEETYSDLAVALVEAWRNLAKLAAWQAGNTAAYQEEAVQNALKEGGDAMRRHLEELLAPILSKPEGR